MEGKVNDVITSTSKLPNMEAIPILNNKYILTWTLGKDHDIKYKTPTVVLTYVGEHPPFVAKAEYSGQSENNQSAVDNSIPSVVSEKRAHASTIENFASNIYIGYYAKPADGNRIIQALVRNRIVYERLEYIGENHERTLSNALICGPNTPVDAVKRIALALMDAGVDIKYIGTNPSINPRQILIMNKFDKSYTLNYPNIARNQIVGLSKTPSALKNY